MMVEGPRRGNVCFREMNQIALTSGMGANQPSLLSPQTAYYGHSILNGLSQPTASNSR
jgi:hypothetical protein